jgi:hypothetical protein
VLARLFIAADEQLSACGQFFGQELPEPGFEALPLRMVVHIVELRD